MAECNTLHVIDAGDAQAIKDYAESIGVYDDPEYTENGLDDNEPYAEPYDDDTKRGKVASHLLHNFAYELDYGASDDNNDIVKGTPSRAA